MPKKKKVITSNPDESEPRKKIDFKTVVPIHEIEDEKIYSSSYYDTAVVFKPNVLRQKLMIATNILVECKEEKEKLVAGQYVDARQGPILNTLSQFTNLPIDELKQINDRVTTRDRSFLKAFNDVRVIHNPTTTLLFDDIRSIFHQYIIEQNSLPTKMDILKELKIKANKYTNELLPIQRLITNKLIKYHHFPGLNRYILMEHPEKVYQRTVYLNNIIEHRKQGRNIVYVEVRRIIPRSTSSSFIAGLAAFPAKGLLEKFFTKDSVELTAKKWLQQRILHLIEEGSVIVLSQPHKWKRISPQPKKSDIMAWLDENAIPYDSDAHTAEVYTLYKTFQSKVKERGIYDHIFQNAGFDVIHCPGEWKDLNFFKDIWSQIEMKDDFHTGRRDALKQNILTAANSLSAINDIEETLIKAESKMLKDDREIEEIMDNILNVVKNGEVPAVEFPKECCGDRTDYFEMHVGNIVIDNGFK